MVSEECNFKDYKVLKEFSGNDFKNTVCQHPFLNLGYDYEVPMLQGDFVTLNKEQESFMQLLVTVQTILIYV